MAFGMLLILSVNKAPIKKTKSRESLHGTMSRVSIGESLFYFLTVKLMEYGVPVAFFPDLSE